MEIRTQNFYTHKPDKTVELRVITHIYAPTGHFQEGGWHIELGDDKSPEDFHEIQDEGVSHEVPETLPDIEIYEEADTEEEATVEDYEAVIEEVFGDV